MTFVPARIGLACLLLAVGLGRVGSLRADTVGAAGSNLADQLGIGDAWSVVPLPVSNIVAIDVGPWHTLALDGDGNVWAWGQNMYGQLGDGTTTQRETPVQITALSNVISISAGRWHSLAVTTGGNVWAWGRNNYGQLGFTCDAEVYPTPIEVTDASIVNVTAVAAGDTFSLALKDDQTLWRWTGGVEFNPYATNPYDPPTFSQINSGVLAVSVGDEHQLELKTDGTVYARGANREGELGIGTTGSSGSGTVSGLADAVAVAAGGFHSLAIRNDGGQFTVVAWGNNTFGQLGDGTTDQSLVPVAVSGLDDVVAIAASHFHSLAVKADGTVWYWGSGLEPKIGGELTGATTPVQVPGISNGSTAAAGDFWSLVLDDTGSVMCLSSHAPSPVEVGGLTGAVRLAAGSYHNLALKQDGSVRAWGANWDYQLGDPTAISSGGLDVPGVADAAAVHAGEAHSLAVGKDGTVRTWGSNEFGQLGDGTTNDSDTPLVVPSIGHVVAAAAGGAHCLALKEDGTVWAWGFNALGQLGDGSTVDRSRVVHVPGLLGVVGVAAGRWHSLAIKNDGSVWAWGANNAGQLGDGNEGFDFNSPVPVRVTDLTDVTVVAAGAYHSLAIKGDGTAWAWGDNVVGQLGDGTSCDGNRSPTPVAVSGLSDVIAVAGGRYHSLAATADGTAWVWGSCSDGRLASGATIRSAVPVEVPCTTDVVRLAAGDNHSLFGRNSSAPAVLATWLGDGVSGPAFCNAVVTFTEPVTNVTVDDLSLYLGNVLSVGGGGAGPYFFRTIDLQRGPNAAAIGGDIADWMGAGLGTHLWLFTQATVSADLDGDGDVDGQDFMDFSVCFNGSLRAPKPGCKNAILDLDGDGDVDGQDYMKFSRCYNGPFRSPMCP